jgi:hypothetical protein
MPLTSQAKFSLHKRRGRRRLHQTSRHLVRAFVPTLIALTLAKAVHAQGTMDFSGAQTLMGTFKATNRPTGTGTLRLFP